MTAIAPSLHDVLRDIVAPPPALSAMPVSGLSLDSRSIAPGAGFVALAGQRQHGLAFADQALARGAACVIYEAPAPDAFADRLDRWPGVGVPVLRGHLGVMADRVYGAPSQRLTMIGVTGTNGKTSVVHLLAQALSGADVDVATIGTLGSGRPEALIEGERTTPDVLSVHALLRRFVDDGVTHVAMEVSSHALDQGRVDGVAFAIAVFTNLSRDHLDYHVDMAAYGEAKARLFAWPGLSTAVVNTDDAFGRQLADRLPAGVRRLRYGLSPLPDGLPEFHAGDVHAGADGLRFRLHAPDGTIDIATPLLGRFNVANLLGVAASLHALGWPVARIADALAMLESVPGRMNRYGGGSRPLVVVDYAHTPDALAQALATLRDHAQGHVLCVFGCGGERDAGKRPQMGAVAEAGADRIIVTDDNPRGENGDAIVADIVGGLAHPDDAIIERDRARAIRLAVSQARAGDIVLIAGKGHEPYQEIGGRKQPFDDAQHARAALEASC